TSSPERLNRLARSLLKLSTSRRAARLRAGHKAGEHGSEALNLMTEVNRNRARRALSILALIVLAASSVLPAFGQRRTTRRRPRLGKYTRPTQQTEPNYQTIPVGQVINVKINQTISSETADRKSTRLNSSHRTI